jgi:hypothetical protein
VSIGKVGIDASRFNSSGEQYDFISLPSGETKSGRMTQVS